MDDDDFGHDADLAALTSAAERSHAASNTNRPAAAAGPSRPKVVQPTPQALPNQRQSASALLVSPRQKGNPLLTHIHSIPWEYTDTPADYILGATSCALFLSLKYHRLHPEYIYGRMRALGRGAFNLRILLTLVDIDAHEEPLRELAKTSLINDYTLVLAWSAREAGRYLEAYKALEKAAPTAIRGQQSEGYGAKMVEFVTVPRGVNKADAVGVVSAFGSVRAAVNAHPEELAAVQGWGEIKVKRWAQVVREPFRTKRAGKQEGTGAAAFTSVGAVSRQQALTRQNTSVEEQVPEVPAWEPGDDDDEALQAANQHTKAGEATEVVVPDPTMAPPAAKKARYEEPNLDEGIAAALAKYRNG